MALPKKGLREITHKGNSYGWSIRKKPTYDQGAYASSMFIGIQSMESDSPQLLHVSLNVPRPDNWLGEKSLSITPSIIVDIIDAAITAGWNPEAGGAAFQLRYSFPNY